MLIVRRLVWNERNVPHIARHDVLPQEVEEVCHGNPTIAETHHNRLLLIGPTRDGRMLGVVLEPTDEEGVYFPVTARPAKRKERRAYQTTKGGETT